MTNTQVSQQGGRRAAAQNDGAATAHQQVLLPPVNVFEDASGITLVADLPGVPKDKVEVQVDGDSLVIEGVVDLQLPEGMESSHSEISSPRYRRTFSLSKELDRQKITAENQNGVLRLRIPKAEHAQPKKITVHVA